MNDHLSPTPVTTAAQSAPLVELLARIKSQDDNVRGPAWQAAGQFFGAEAVPPLIVMMSDLDYETARCARRALWTIVRSVGVPGEEVRAAAVAAALCDALRGISPAVGREVVWMVSEIGNDDSVPAVAALLTDSALREDARCVLTRLPGKKSLEALKAGFSTGSEDFKFALAESLRTRGVEVQGYASKRMVPTKPTSVHPFNGPGAPAPSIPG